MYAPLAPLVVMCAAVLFWTSSIVVSHSERYTVAKEQYTNQLKYVSITKADSNGRAWRVVINRITTGMVLMQLLMTISE